MDVDANQVIANLARQNADLAVRVAVLEAQVAVLQQEPSDG